MILILTEKQREILAQAHQLVYKNSLIPAHKSYIEQINTYDGQCQKAGLDKIHGLRHTSAQARYETLTDLKSPKEGDLARKELTPEQQIKDGFARQIISQELGYELIEVVGCIRGSDTNI